MTERLRLADLLGGLSLVADMGYGLPPGEAIRSCVIGVGIARRLDLADSDVADTFYATLLAHVGCVGFAHDMASVFGDEMASNRAGARTNFGDPRDVLTTLIPETVRGTAPVARIKAATYIVVRGRSLGRRYDTTVCEVGTAVARGLGLPDGVQRSLYEIKEWWNGGGNPRGLKGEEAALPARIARVAADAALFSDRGGADLAIEALERRAGGMLDPSLVALVAADPAVFADADTGDPRQRMLDLEPAPVIEKEPEALVDVAAVFGDLADLKTPFTAGHSRAVAALSTAAAEALALDAPTVRRVQIAAHLHDIGRVGIGNGVWEKPGPLSSADWEQVPLYPYHSERIMTSSPALEPSARLAGMHQERLEGSGYHRGCRAGELPVGARLLAAADVFQAMTEDRPHRRPATLAAAAEELAREARAGRLDADAVAAVVEAAGQRARRRSGREHPSGLSQREVDVLRLMAAACSNREIGERLHISRRTAEHHVQHIYTKLGVSTRSAAALFATQHDLMPARDDQ